MAIASVLKIDTSANWVVDFGIFFVVGRTVVELLSFGVRVTFFLTSLGRTVWWFLRDCSSVRFDDIFRLWWYGVVSVLFNNTDLIFGALEVVAGIPVDDNEAIEFKVLSIFSDKFSDVVVLWRFECIFDGCGRFPAGWSDLVPFTRFAGFTNRVDDFPESLSSEEIAWEIVSLKSKSSSVIFFGLFSFKCRRMPFNSIILFLSTWIKTSTWWRDFFQLFSSS